MKKDNTAIALSVFSLILLIIYILLIILCVTGCSSTSYEVNKDYYAKQICNFEKVYEDVNVGLGGSDDIVVDMNTGVIYYKYNSDGLCPIYNADGTLKIWQRKYEERKNEIQEKAN